MLLISVSLFFTAEYAEEVKLPEDRKSVKMTDKIRADYS